jgi:hypothetical protein
VISVIVARCFDGDGHARGDAAGVAGQDIDDGFEGVRIAELEKRGAGGDRTGAVARDAKDLVAPVERQRVLVGRRQL